MGVSYNGRRFDGGLQLMEIFCGTSGEVPLFFRSGCVAMFAGAKGPSSQCPNSGKHLRMCSFPNPLSLYFFKYSS